MKELKRVDYGAGRTDHPLMSPSFFPTLERAAYLEAEAQTERAHERRAPQAELQPPASIEVAVLLYDRSGLLHTAYRIHVNLYSLLVRGPEPCGS